MTSWITPEPWLPRKVLERPGTSLGAGGTGARTADPDGNDAASTGISGGWKANSAPTVSKAESGGRRSCERSMLSGFN